MKKLVSLLLCLAMLLSLASFTAAEAAETTEETEIVWDENHETILLEYGAEYGEGETSFYLGVIYMNQVDIVVVHTNETTVGAALEALNIVAGEDSEYGLYIKTINGVTADYSTDGSYWAFYINGEYATTGADATEIEEEGEYVFIVEGVELDEDETIPLTDGKVYGLGEKMFTLQVCDADGNEIEVYVCTDQETVGAALAEWQIVAGEDSDYGLYIKTVNGITADYDTDGTYWSFYIDGEYAMTGVDSTEISEDSVYLLKVEG